MDFYSKSQKPMVVALGFFDGVHLGHKSLLDKAKTMLKDGDSLVLFTIEGKFFKNKEGNIFSFKEKMQIFAELGVDEVILAQASEEFFNLSAEDFLERLFTNHIIKGVVAGEDFTFGKNAVGNSVLLEQACRARGVECKICPILCKNGEKISSSIIKRMLSEGKVQEVAQLLGMNYYISGKVTHGRGVGSKELFPTANILLSKDKFKLKSGVYATLCEIDGVKYNAVTNYGNCPTYEQNDFSIEAFILDFNGNIYEKEIKLEFLSYLREIRKFSSVEELKNQIKEDTEYFL